MVIGKNHWWIIKIEGKKVGGEQISHTIKVFPPQMIVNPRREFSLSTERALRPPLHPSDQVGITDGGTI